MKLRILTISDTHGLHEATERKGLPQADMIMHGGDVSNTGTIYGLEEFIKWYASLDYEHKVLIGGNHDFGLETSGHMFKSIMPDNMHYLRDSEIEIEGLKIWGSPYTPTFLNWAFMRDRGPSIKQHWDAVPTDTDVLLTHGPPNGILDYLPADLMNRWEAQHCGCVDQLNMLRQLKLPLVVMGHIHEGFGTKKIGKTQFINTASVDGRYIVRPKPYHLIEMDTATKEVFILE